MPRMWFYGFLNPENERCAARAGLGLMRAKRFFCDINVWNVFLNVFISWYQAGSHLDFDQLFPSSRGGSSEGCYSVPIWRSLHTQELILAVVSDICIIFILAEVSPAYSHFPGFQPNGVIWGLPFPFKGLINTYWFQHRCYLGDFDIKDTTFPSLYPPQGCMYDMFTSRVTIYFTTCFFQNEIVCSLRQNVLLVLWVYWNTC